MSNFDESERPVFRFIDYDPEKHPTGNSDYHHKVLEVDIESATKDSASIRSYLLHVRDLIRSDFFRICRRTKSRPPWERIKTKSFAIPGGGLANVHFVDRVEWLSKSSNVARIQFKNLNFNFVVRDKFYTSEHYIMAMYADQEIIDPQQLDACLRMCQVLGDGHEAVFNRANPAYDGFHMQFIKRTTPLWDCATWPIQTQLFSNPDSILLSQEVYAELQRVGANEGKICDLFLRWTESQYEIRVLKRRHVRDPDDPVQDAKYRVEVEEGLKHCQIAPSVTSTLVSRPLGGLEMAGFFPVGLDEPDRLRMVEWFSRHPNKYEAALGVFAA